MTIKKTYARYCQVCREIEARNQSLKLGKADNRPANEKLAELSELYAEYYDLESELRARLKPFVDMLRELGANYIAAEIHYPNTATVVRAQIGDKAVFEF